MVTPVKGPQATAHGDATKVRNVVLVGHSGAGKTTLVEALLVAAGAINRAGQVDDGTTVCDFDEAEQSSAAVGVAGGGPGHPRRASRSTCSTPRATPTSSASCGPGCGPPTRPCSSSRPPTASTALTRMLWEECAAVGMPRAVVITKLDHQRADFDDDRWSAAGRLRRQVCCRCTCPCRRRRPAGRSDRPAVPAGAATYSSGHARRPRAPTRSTGRRSSSPAAR